MNKDGGPAFPGKDRINGWDVSGMSLRDYFAGQALNGLLACSERARNEPEDHGLCVRFYVLAAYELADAMLKERG